MVTLGKLYGKSHLRESFPCSDFTENEHWRKGKARATLSVCVIAVIILIYTFLIAVILLFLESWDIGSTKDVEAFFQL